MQMFSAICMTNYGCHNLVDKLMFTYMMSTFQLCLLAKRKITKGVFTLAKYSFSPFISTFVFSVVYETCMQNNQAKKAREFAQQLAGKAARLKFSSSIAFCV